MIKKVLVVGKNNIYITTKKPDAHLDQGHAIEVEMPVEEYWKLEEILKQALYLQSAGESGSDIFSQYKRVFNICAIYAVNEKDRTWLAERAGHENARPQRHTSAQTPKPPPKK